MAQCIFAWLFSREMTIGCLRHCRVQNCWMIFLRGFKVFSNDWWDFLQILKTYQENTNTSMLLSLSWLSSHQRKMKGLYKSKSILTLPWQQSANKLKMNTSILRLARNIFDFSKEGGLRQVNFQETILGALKWPSHSQWLLQIGIKMHYSLVF